MSAQTSAEWPVLSIKGSPDPEVLGDIRALTDAASEADGNPPLSEQTWVNLKSVDPDNLLVLASYAGEERSDPSTATSLAGVAVVNLPAHG
jgi:mycothiol synthase